jgi:hypothetical protein
VKLPAPSRSGEGLLTAWRKGAVAEAETAKEERPVGEEKRGLEGEVVADSPEFTGDGGRAELLTTAAQSALLA